MFNVKVITIYRAVKKAARGRLIKIKVYSNNITVVKSCKYKLTLSLQAKVVEVNHIFKKRKNITLH